MNSPIPRNVKGIRRYKDNDLVGRISESSAQNINRFGLGTDASDVVITSKAIDHIDRTHGKQLPNVDIDRLQETIEKPTRDTTQP